MRECHKCGHDMDRFSDPGVNLGLCTYCSNCDGTCTACDGDFCGCVCEHEPGTADGCDCKDRMDLMLAAK